MNALFTIFALLGLVACVSAQFGFGPGFGRGPTVTKTIVTETRPGFGGNGFNRGPGFNNGFNNGGFNNGFARGPAFHHPHGGFNNGFNAGPSTITRTITTFGGK